MRPKDAPTPRTSHPGLALSHEHSGTAVTAPTYTLLTEPADGLAALYSLVSGATKSIDLTMYELTDTTMTSLLAKAAARGVQVRVILDQNSEKEANTPAYAYLTANKVACHWANPVYACTHQKTLTVDAATSAIMTLNLVTADYPVTRDYAVITNDAADVAAIEATFAADFQNAALTPPTGDNLVWSPTNALEALSGLIQGATQSLALQQEELDDATLVAALKAALGRGVAVTMVQENVKGAYTAELTSLKAAGARIAVYTDTAPTAYYIHAKIVLADYGAPSARMFLGSENFTRSSLGSNRELGLIFSDPACLAGVKAAIDADFAGGTPF